MSQNYMNFIFNATPNVAIDKLNFKYNYLQIHDWHICQLWILFLTLPWLIYKGGGNTLKYGI